MFGICFGGEVEIPPFPKEIDCASNKNLIGATLSVNNPVSDEVEVFLNLITIYL